MKTRYYFSFFILMSILLISSCKTEGNRNTGENNEITTNGKDDKNNPLLLKIEVSDKDKRTGDVIRVSIEGSNLETGDTVLLFINKQEAHKFGYNHLSFDWNTAQAKTGTNILDIELEKDGLKYTRQERIILFSNIVPEKYTYKVKNTYKHDENSYTQGLFYYAGFLYEATGLKGESTVRKVKPETGEVLQSFAIPSDVFGEGILKFEDRIIQISWDSNRGFVYDFSTFKLIDEFSYQGEGWGLCTDEKFLYMTNGSNRIKILETESYSEINSLEVYDDKGPVKYLNELEYIEGYIYSNIYQYDHIAKIDPVTGKVLAYIDLKGLLPMNDYTNKTDVFNGIAYDRESKRIFVTGKNWPKLFEIQIVKK
jgi:glutamine cyclotransferase